MTLMSLLVAPVFLSCSSDDKDNKNELEGTTWRAILEGGHWVATVQFVDKSSFNYTETEGGNTRRYSGTYSYNKPTITLTFTTSSYGVVTGTITGNQAVVQIWGEFITFIKQ